MQLLTLYPISPKGISTNRVPAILGGSNCILLSRIVSDEECDGLQTKLTSTSKDSPSKFNGYVENLIPHPIA